MNQQDAAASQR